MRRIPLAWIVFIVAVCVAFPADAADDGLAERKDSYREQLAALPVLQNPDGGFGRPVEGANGSAPSTSADADSYLETIFTTSLLLVEGTEPLATWDTWYGPPGSLAASNVSSALDWVRGYEADADGDLTPGEHSLVALAYAPLGDAGNAERVLEATLATEQEAPGTLSSHDAAQLLFVLAHSDLATDDEQNATIASLSEHVGSHTYTTLEGQAWALLAQPDLPAHAHALAEMVTQSDATSQRGLALAAWALTASPYTKAEADATLAALHDSAPTGAARAFYLLGELNAHPAFSPNAPAPPVVQAGVALPFAGKSPNPATDAATPSPVVEVEQATGGDNGGAFPLPVWLMGGILVVALAVVVVAGLAYGLRREDLNGPRREIFNFIEHNPGAHFSEIRRTLGFAPGTFQHHLSILESEGWITSHKEARYKRYYVNGNRYQKMIAGYAYKQKFAAIANETTRTFVRYVQDHPGATQKMVAARLNLHASTVNWHAKRLKQAGILRDERVGKEVRYTVDDSAVGKMIRATEEREETPYAPMPAM